MLVVSRKKDQTIQIGNEITIQICQIKGRTVRIGISAPEKERTIRGELAWELDVQTNVAGCHLQCVAQRTSAEDMAA